MEYGEGIHSNPRTWNVEQVIAWLEKQNFDEIVINQFKSNNITGKLLFLLNDEHLKEMNLDIGTRFNLLHIIKILGTKPESPIYSPIEQRRTMASKRNSFKNSLLQDSGESVSESEGNGNSNKEEISFQLLPPPED